MKNTYKFQTLLLILFIFGAKVQLNALMPQGEMFQAIEKIDPKKLASTIKNGANVNEKNVYSGHAACYEAVTKLAEYLNLTISWQFRAATACLPVVGIAATTTNLQNLKAISLKNTVNKIRNLSLQSIINSKVSLVTIIAAAASYKIGSSALEIRSKINNLKQIIKIIKSQPNFVLDRETKEYLKKNSSVLLELFSELN